MFYFHPIQKISETCQKLAFTHSIVVLKSGLKNNWMKKLDRVNRPLYFLIQHTKMSETVHTSNCCLKNGLKNKCKNWIVSTDLNTCHYFNLLKSPNNDLLVHVIGNNN